MGFSPQLPGLACLYWVPAVSSAAFYRCEVKVISRAAGRSATAAAAYRSSNLIHDLRTGEDHDYTRRRGVAHSEIILPDDAPEELKGRAALWNAAEAAENRRNSRVAREVMVSMPHELHHPEQRISAARAMAQWLVGEYGVGVDIAVHEPDRKADERNYHAHILFTTRRVDADGFAAKTRELDDKTQGPEEVERIRQGWEEIGNRHLELAGHEPSLDRRSLQDRGIDREPEPKLGPVASEMERDGRRSNAGDDIRAVKARNAELERLIAEGKVIDLAIERAKRQERTHMVDENSPQKPPERLPELFPAELRAYTQDNQLEQWGKFNDQSQRQRMDLEQQLKAQYAESDRQDQAKMAQLDQAARERNRFASWWAGVTGRAEEESRKAAALQLNLENSAQRQAEQRDHLALQHQQQRQDIEKAHEAARVHDETRILERQNAMNNDRVAAVQQQVANDPEPTPALVQPEPSQPVSRPPEPGVRVAYRPAPQPEPVPERQVVQTPEPVVQPTPQPEPQPDPRLEPTPGSSEAATRSANVEAFREAARAQIEERAHDRGIVRDDGWSREC